MSLTGSYKTFCPKFLKRYIMLLDGIVLFTNSYPCLRQSDVMNTHSPPPEEYETYVESQQGIYAHANPSPRMQVDPYHSDPRFVDETSKSSYQPPPQPIPRTIRPPQAHAPSRGRENLTDQYPTERQRYPQASKTLTRSSFYSGVLEETPAVPPPVPVMRYADLFPSARK